MKKLGAAILTAIAAVLIHPGVAQATPDLCGEHADYADLPNGPGQGSRYITACGGDGGPDYGNSALTPDNFPDTTAVDAGHPAITTRQTDASPFGDSQNVADEDGIQGHDNVTNSPLYVPQTKAVQ